MKKTFGPIIIILIISAMLLSGFTYSKTPSVYLDDEPLSFSLPIKNIYGRLYVPYKQFFSQIQKTQLFSSNKFSLDQNTKHFKNLNTGEKITINLRSFYGTAYIPLRSVAEFIGFKITWDNYLKRAYLRSPQNYVVVLAYGNIIPEKQKLDYLGKSFVTVENFKSQMEYLHKEGYSTLDLATLKEFINGNIQVDKAVVLTFDGGYSNFYMYAYPLLKKYNFHGIVFVETTAVGRTSDLSYMGWNRLKEMSKEGIIEVNSLTHNMYNFEGEAYRIIRTRPSEIIKDLKISRQLIKILIEKEASAIAYPHGIYNDAIITYAKQAGFEMGFTTKRGYVEVGDNKMTLHRNYIYDWMDLSYFKKILNKQ